MSSNQIIILSVFLGYLLFNVVVSFAYSKRQRKVCIHLKRTSILSAEEI